ncbi:hypothetical protein GCG54_00004838 [Colletotrichum gloeosporioides]|uniref:Restriction of telomere capping protein 4 n=1 Tax=Colletotrichum gloeosporioides TaxID=474922 RepID=A0A8H4CH17_COLGL|nr:uncharacterized protein GCG54_00004838 [Colletotrichum gloeosporioides]KAF3803664.1 hypothetical protein GCG54_00004838 [Colletotrichum gloeosporioides]
MSHFPPPRRRSGLPRDPRTPGLLKTVNNKSRENVKPAKVVMPAAEMTEAQVCELPQDDSDEVSEPDMPSESEDEVPGDTQEERSSSEGKYPKVVPKPTDDPDSDADYAARKEKIDVRQTYFGTSKSGREQERNFRASQETGSGPKLFGGSQGSNSQPRGSKRSSPDTASPGPESKRGRTGRVDDGKDTAKLIKLSQNSSQRKGYGKKDKKEMEKLRRMEEKKKEKKREKEEAKKARQPAPEVKMPSFKSYDDDPFEKFDAKKSPKSLVNPGASFLSSPPGSPRKTFVAHSSLSPISSPQRKIKAEFKDPSASLPEPLPSSGTAPARLRDLVPSLETAPKMLKDPFAELPDSDLDDDEDESPSYSQPLETVTRCPMCGDPVDKNFLDAFSNGARLRIHRQLQFCRQHKKKSAEDAWKTRGYPDIDWVELGCRLSDHYDFLEEIIKGGRSHYGDRLIDTVKEGKNRTLLKAEGSLTPGYYGPRGLRALSEDIIARFSSILRERAIDDRLISSRGYSSYVEAVLVPELAVKLICEDMNVEPTEARKILEDSKEIGDMINEDIGDTVDQVSDDERDTY